MTATAGGTVRRIWFHRQYERLTGGHVKHAQYLAHVRQTPGFAPRLTFSLAPGGTPELLRQRAALWPLDAGEEAAGWSPAAADLLFVAGTDWRYVLANGLDRLPNPRLNLLQGIRHAQRGDELRAFLPQPAIRLCVSPEVAAAVAATGEANGPIVTIPNGTDVRHRPMDAARWRGQRIAMVSYKEPALASALAERLEALGAPYHLLADFLPRQQFIETLAVSAVAVCLPWAEEGFYLPALEAMAAGCLVVTLDCVGNRSFCQHGRNCLIANRDASALASTVAEALRLPAPTRARLLVGAAETVRNHSLAAERARFQAVLRDVDALWADCAPKPAARASRQAPRPAPPPAQASAADRQPVVDFMIVGVQKGGTTALAEFLGQHPQIGMARPKEVHLFDAEDYPADAPPTALDERYRPHFAHCPGARLRGEATPIYLFLPEIAAQLKRYNPALKLIVLLRDPVERALSTHRMQRARGREPLPFALALLAERWRLRRDPHPSAQRSALREHAYRRRGLYADQLANLFAVFDRRQVLILRNEALLRQHAAILRRAFAFLGVDDSIPVPPAVVFPTTHQDGPHRLACALLRLSYRPANRRLGRLLAHEPERG